MPKMKTRRAAAKRFKVTGKGKIKRFHAYAGHKFTKKTAKRKRNLRQADTVDKVDVPRIKKMLGV
ncbi:MAG TPA: 50S ribosomal protein L35 [Candidatus Cloacimonas sp.]|jgi:large subunit ribosomal protein L35|nr:large subunit ribosomal protein [Candidatus Cloacimonadota bacterium]HCX73197.1 50S ribosomal protein L35 [Candidatus Cloacimonas sp.]